MDNKRFMRKDGREGDPGTSKLKLNKNELSGGAEGLDAAVERLGAIFDLDSVNWEVQTLQEKKTGNEYTALVVVNEVIDGTEVIEAKNEEGQTQGEAIVETKADNPDAKVVSESPDKPPKKAKPSKKGKKDAPTESSEEEDPEDTKKV